MFDISGPGKCSGYVYASVLAFQVDVIVCAREGSGLAERRRLETVDENLVQTLNCQRLRAGSSGQYQEHRAPVPVGSGWVLEARMYRTRHRRGHGQVDGEGPVKTK
jgi:hypothetical protein